MRVLIKDPDAVLDYGLDWSAYLEQDETITASLWLVTPADDIVVESATFLPTSSRVILSGGTSGHLYSVTNRIETSLDRQDDRSFTVRVQSQ